MRRALFVAVSVVALFAGAACGDDDDSGGSNGGGGSDAQSRDGFVEQANEICQEGEERLEAIGEDVFGDLDEGETPSDDQIRDFFDKFSDEVKSQIGDLRDLEPPDDIADDVEEALDLTEEALDDFGDTVDDDPQAAFESDEDPFEDVNDKLEAVGLEECSD